MRYSLKTDWLFYLFLLSYAFLIFNMTSALWFGGGVNIFASYSDATEPAAAILDANKVYWSKTSFLFLTLLFAGLKIDMRAGIGIAASFWAGSLTLIFGASQNVIVALVIGVALVAQQIWRGSFFAKEAKT